MSYTQKQKETLSDEKKTIEMKNQIVKPNGEGTHIPCAFGNPSPMDVIEEYQLIMRPIDERYGKIIMDWMMKDRNFHDND